MTTAAANLRTARVDVGDSSLFVFRRFRDRSDDVPHGCDLVPREGVQPEPLELVLPLGVAKVVHFDL